MNEIVENSAAIQEPPQLEFSNLEIQNAGTDTTDDYEKNFVGIYRHVI
jgi:hypothetical protein